MRLKRYCWIAIGLLTAGCSSQHAFEPQISAVLNTTFDLRVGQQVSFGVEPLHLVFERVSEDSRCPSDVTCVWEGNARIQLRASTPSESGTTISLNTGLAPRSVLVSGYDISLERLEPYPTSKSRIPQNRYVAYIVVNKP